MPRPIALRFAALAALGCLAIVPARAGNVGDMITFETRPDGSTPEDNEILRGRYALAGGGSVGFFFDKNGNNVFDRGIDEFGRFERVGTEGDGTDGFVATTAGGSGQGGVFDRPRAGSGLGPQLGRFFLRQPDPIGILSGALVIDYDTPLAIREFSGEIWDIDAGANGFEQWRVDVLNASGSILATAFSPKGLPPNHPDSLDSLPWVFGFKGLPDGVKAIRVSFTTAPGAKRDGIGLAFNNFSPTFAVPGSAVPEPSSLVMLGAAAALGLAATIRRRRGA